jgi:hypothetical protein
MIGVSLFFIKKYINILSSPLSHIFSLSLRNGVVPIQLKIAKVVPVLNLVINNPWTIIALFHCLAIFQKSYKNSRLITFIEDQQISVWF